MTRPKTWGSLREVAEAIWSPEAVAALTAPEKVRDYREAEEVRMVLAMVSRSLGSELLESLAMSIANDDSLSARARTEAQRALGPRRERERRAALRREWLAMPAETASEPRDEQELDNPFVGPSSEQS